MWYLNADSGFRVAEYPNHRGWLEVFGGFQYWYTKYEATGLTQMACDTACPRRCALLQSSRNRTIKDRR